MEEFTAIDSGVNGYKWRYRFYKKSLQQYKMVVARTRHNSTQGFELYCGLSRASHLALLWVEPCSSSLISYMLNIRLGTSPTRSVTYVYICILFTARLAPSRHTPFAHNPSIRPFSVYFSAPPHPPVTIQLTF